MRVVLLGGLLLLLALQVLPPGAATAAVGDPAAGADDFRLCAACHSLEPGRHRTGPSLAGLLGRQSGTAEGFRRYSPALKAAGVVWDKEALDAWIASPQTFVPGNGMKFKGMPDPQMRADLIAYLVQTGESGAPTSRGGMMNMGADEPLDLKALGPEHQVTAIRHCEDTYEITTADGTTEPFWEMNLRFKTDGSERGPKPDKPVIVAAGMVGDRASVVFASPQEISPAIRQAC